MRSHLKLVKPEAELRAADEDYPFVVRAVAGEAVAQAALFERHVQRLTSMLTRLLASTTDAEDAAQDAFAIAFGEIGKLRDLHAFGGWLWQIAVNQAHRRFRRRRFNRLLGLDRHVPDATLEQLVDCAMLPDARVDLARVDRILNDMPAKDRTAWMLRYIEGHEMNDVAQICDCSLATAKRRIGAAKAKLVEHLDLEGLDE